MTNAGTDSNRHFDCDREKDRERSRKDHFLTQGKAPSPPPQTVPGMNQGKIHGSAHTTSSYSASVNTTAHSSCGNVTSGNSSSAARELPDIKDEIAVILCSLSQRPVLDSVNVPNIGKEATPKRMGTKKTGGRPRKNSETGIDAESKRLLRMEGNRQAAKRCRERRKSYILQLENRLRQLEDMNANLVTEISSLQGTVGPGVENVGHTPNGNRIEAHIEEGGMTGNASEGD